MKPIVRCEYCDRLGTEEAMLKHEAECLYNYNKKSCFTCKFAEQKPKSIDYSCNAGKEIPSKQVLLNCSEYVWDTKVHVTENPCYSNSFFGGLFI